LGVTVQAEANAAAHALLRPEIELINAQEEAWIRELIAQEPGHKERLETR
jgi:hypothetical protein